MKILLTAIFKDDTEIELATRMLDSFMPHMSGLAVAITGLSGEHKKLTDLIEKHKGKYVITTPQTHPQIYLKEGDSYIFADFAAARNVSFDLASTFEGMDFWTWADVDDVLIGGEELQNIAKQSKDLDLDMVFFTYWYSVLIKSDGSFTDKDVQIEHLRERLIKPNVLKWISRLHEVTVPKDENYKPKNAVFDYNPKEGRQCVWVHITEHDRVMNAMSRNIKILEAQKKEETSNGKDDPRTTFYLAKTYYDLGDPENLKLAYLLLQDYLDKSGWAEERSNAWEYMGNIKTRQGDHLGAIECFHSAMKEFGNRHMPMLLLSQEYAAIGNFEQSDFWLDVAMKMDEPKSRTTIGNPLQIRFMAASLKYNQCLRNQKIDDAIKWMKVRNDLVETEEDKNILKGLEDMQLMNQAAMWVFNYARWLKDKGHTSKIKHVLEALPPELGREQFAQIMAQDFTEPRVWGDKEICYYASWGTEHFEKWSPLNTRSGIGGSETAVIELAKRWAKDGWKVTVYGDPREDEGEHEGVIYRPWYEINWKDEFNILILWRSPHLLERDIKAKKLFMDLHDVASQLDWNEKRMEKIDKVFVKSNYHRSMLPKLPDDKVAVITNGI